MSWWIVDPLWPSGFLFSRIHFCLLQTLSGLRLADRSESLMLLQGSSLYQSLTNQFEYIFFSCYPADHWLKCGLSPGASRTGPFLPAQWWFPTDSPVWDLLLRWFLIHLRCALLGLCGANLVLLVIVMKVTVLETLSLLHPLSCLYQVTCNPFKEWNEVCLTRLIQWFWWVLIL